MNRRHALRHIALISGGLALIPSCDFSKEDILSAYENLKITTTQKDLLAAISDSIIPAGEIKGALDLEVVDFILVLTSKEKVDLILQGISLEEDESLEGKKRGEISYFLNTIKRFTIQGYMASEYIQTEIIPYSLIPGEYNGAVLISDLQKPRING